MGIERGDVWCGAIVGLSGIRACAVACVDGVVFTMVHGWSCARNLAAVGMHGDAVMDVIALECIISTKTKYEGRESLVIDIGWVMRGQRMTKAIGCA